MQWRWFVVLTCVVLTWVLAVVCLAATPAPKPEGTLTVAVATFGNERWLPQLYVGAEDVVLKPMYENLLSRDLNTGALIPLLAERWEMLDGGRAWRFQLRQGVQFHGGQGEVTAEDVKFTFAAIAREGSANGLAPEFRLIKSMEVEDPYTLTLRFEKPFVTFGNKVSEPATRMAMLRASSVDIIEIGGEYVEELQKVGVRTLTMPNVSWVYIIL